MNLAAHNKQAPSSLGLGEAFGRGLFLAVELPATKFSNPVDNDATCHTWASALREYANDTHQQVIQHTTSKSKLGRVSQMSAQYLAMLSGVATLPAIATAGVILHCA